jgi:hypothetical protein
MVFLLTMLREHDGREPIDEASKYRRPDLKIIKRLGGFAQGEHLMAKMPRASSVETR